MRVRLIDLMSLGIVFLATGLFFQNCGKAGMDNSDGSGTIKFSSIGTNAPFAFDTKIDQITYMSCFAGSAPTDSSFFTLRVGAFQQLGGMKLRPEFLSYVKSEVEPVYPNTDITLAQFKQVMSESPENLMAIPRFGLRSRFNVQNPIGNQGFAVGLDIINLLGDLSSENYMATYVNSSMLLTSSPISPKFVRYFPLAEGFSGSQRRLDGTLKLDLKTSGESLAAQVRKNLSVSPNSAEDAAILALTYAPYQSNPMQARVPSAETPDPKVAYGSGFDLTFGQQSSSGDLPHSQNPQNVLVAVSEFDLANSKRPPVLSRWDCSRRYKIFRHSDVSASVCPSFNPALLLPQGGDTIEKKKWRKELEIAYNQLDPASWEVNPDLRCAYPKSPNVSCYDETQKLPDGTFVGVQYNNAQPCFRSIDDTGLSAMNYSGPPPTRLCAQYISICVRNN